MHHPIVWVLPNTIEWKQQRDACHFTASELGALMGVGIYTSRAKIVAKKRNGNVAPEEQQPTNEFKEKLFADGHEDERFAIELFFREYYQTPTADSGFVVNQVSYGAFVKRKMDNLLVGASPDRLIQMSYGSHGKMYIPIEAKTSRSVNYTIMKDRLPEAEWILQNLCQQWCLSADFGYIVYYNRVTTAASIYTVDFSAQLWYDKIWPQVLHVFGSIIPGTEKLYKSGIEMEKTQKKKRQKRKKQQEESSDSDESEDDKSDPMYSTYHPASISKNKEYHMDYSGAIVPHPVEDQVFDELSASLAEINRKKALEDEQKQKDALKLLDNDPDAYDAEGVLLGTAASNPKGKTTKGTKQSKEQHKDNQTQNKEESECDDPQQASSDDAAAGSRNGKVQLLTPRPFDINIVRPDYTMTFFGRRGTGKSYTMRWILYKLRHLYAGGIVFSRTKHNGFWQELVPERFIHDDIDEDVILGLIEYQKAQKKLKKDNPGLNTRRFVIFEDCIDQNLRYKTILDKLFFNGRHYDLLIMISSQYPKALHPGVRGNTDLAVVFQQAALNERKAISEQYAGELDPKSIYTLIDKHCKVDPKTGKRTFLAFDVRNWDGKEWVDCVYLGSADEVPPFILGTKEYWGDELEERQQKAIERHRALLKKVGLLR